MISRQLGNCFAVLCFINLVSLSLQDHDVFYSITREREDEMATTINCQVNKSIQYKYSSVVDLWSDIQGRIILEADVTLFCLGDDNGGKYGTDALKYVAHISNLKIDEQHKSFVEPLRRRKRGIGDWFYNAWISVKNFFINLFGGSTESSPQISDDRRYDENPRYFTERTVDYFTEDPYQFSTKEQTTTKQTTTTAIPSTTTFKDELEREDEYYDYKYRDLYSAPFVFIQQSDGAVPEVRFASNDTDGRVRNFKRHLLDAFATHLNMNPTNEIVETSVMGEHRSQYNVTVISTIGAMSSAFTAADKNQKEKSTLEEEVRDVTVVVEKKVTNRDIVTLAPSVESKALNDKQKLELEAQQTQIFENGALVSSTGTSNLVLFPESTKGKIKRAAEENSEDNILKYIQAHSQHQLQLQKRVKRSLDNNYLESMMDGVTFSAASRAAEVEDSAARQRLRELQQSLGDPTVFINDLLKNDDVGNEKLQNMFEVVDQEVKYSLDEEPESLTRELKRSISLSVIEDICTRKFKRCIDVLQLLARAGGSKAEEILLHFITSNHLELRQRQQVTDLISDLSNPSLKIMRDLNGLLRGNDVQPQLLGSIALSTSNMVTKVNEDQKKALSETLSRILESSWSATQSNTNPLTIDILEAFGNIGSVYNVDLILKISAESSQSLDIQVACAHALRHATTMSRVQDWIRKIVSNGPCDVLHSVVGSLLDQLHTQEMSGDEKGWPRNIFNDIDTTLQEKLVSSAPEIECASADIARYLHRKKSKGGKSEKDFFDTDSEAFQPGSRSRQRRGVLDECGDWTEDNKYHPIQGKDEFEADRELYNKKKSCLLSKKLGMTGAKAEIYAGMFAGVKEPSNPPKYKLFTKFVSGVNFFGHEMEIGSFYFYHHSGYTKAYVRIMGKTRQEFRNEGCTESELRYHPVLHIPLYLMQISVLQFSLGIHLSSNMALETVCPRESIYEMSPQSTVRIGGEAMATVLFARGSINIGGNFNYDLRFTFSPIPDMCLTGQHGYNPMSISMEAFYQLWNVWGFRWGKPRIWSPSFLKWELNNGKRQIWFNDTCILKARSTTQIPAVTSTSNPLDLDDENEVLVVKA